MRLIKAIIDNEDGTVTILQNIDDMELWKRGDMLQLNLYWNPNNLQTVEAKSVSLGLTPDQRRALTQVVREALTGLTNAQRAIHEVLKDREET